ncbi:MAG: ice-binding family protein [Gemmatimonadota bacterium]
MDTHNRATRLGRAQALPAFAAGCLVTFALLLAGCGDSASPTNSELSSSTNEPSAAAAKQAAVTSSFAILANQAVTATDATITGDVGTYQAPPTGKVTLTRSKITGTKHVGDAEAIAAYDNFLSAYAAITPDEEDSLLTGTLAGLTLEPGVYYFTAAATLTGVLTLDGPADGVWLFKIGTLGTGALTGTNFQVVMAGGAVPCNVTWWVSQAVTMTTSDFQGNILAGAAITMDGGTFYGNAWSQADVTVTGTDVIGCECTNCNPGDDNGNGNDKGKCNQGVGNGPEDCDPGNSNHNHSSNDENGGTPGNPGRKGGH